MDASKVAEEVPLHVFGELGTLLRRGAVERDTPLEALLLRIIDSVWPSPLLRVIAAAAQSAEVNDE
jgi:hypothetical protein